MIYLLPHIIEESADRFPDNEPFRFQGVAISYAEFARQVRCLANLLLEQGIQRGDRVGIYRNKGLQSAVAMYGIMAAGAAYVPLDAGMPLQRLGTILEDCGIRDLVTEPDQADSLKALLAQGSITFRTLVGLGEDIVSGPVCISWSHVSEGPDYPPKVDLVEQDLAYVMYTSGSTGKPKGLMHTHKSGLSYARMAAETYGVNERDRLANHSSLYFDMSTFDYFSGPLCGATTVIISEQCAKFPAEMSRLVEDESITIWYSVPWALIQLLRYGALEKRDLNSLRWVMFGGEPFPIKHLRALMQAIPKARFSNVYGPAEVNQCTYYHLPHPPASTDDSVPIGRIWANAEGLLLGENDSPVSPGEVGELLVRTPTMMQGYWGRPDLNDEIFYRLVTAGGLEHIYLRTGDLVRENPNGDYLFVGRKDRQVKIRGYRVELDEVEATLHTLDGVIEAAVVSIFDGELTNHIKAAVTLKPGIDLEQKDIIAFVRKKIPSYAVPEKVAVLVEFPRTTSGKINRRELQNLL